MHVIIIGIDINLENDNIVGFEIIWNNNIV